MKRATTVQKVKRLEHVNALIETISLYGRRFFCHKESTRVAQMRISTKGHIYFLDDYTQKLVYVAYEGHWRGFSHGGTLKELVRRMADYVRTGDRIEIDWIGPERMRITDGNIWGYAEDEMAKCRAEALLNPAVQS